MFLEETSAPPSPAPPVVKQIIQPPELPHQPLVSSAWEEEDSESSPFSLDQPLSISVLLTRILLLGGVVFLVLTAILLTFRGCSSTTPSPPADEWRISEKIYPSSTEETEANHGGESHEEKTDWPLAENSEPSVMEEEDLPEDGEVALSEELMQSDLGRQLLGSQEISPIEKIPPLPETETTPKNPVPSPSSSEKKRITIAPSDSDEELDFSEPAPTEPLHEDRLEFQRKTRPALFKDETNEKQEPEDTLQEVQEGVPALSPMEPDVFAEEETSDAISVPSHPSPSTENLPPIQTVSESAGGEYLPESVAQKLDFPLKHFQMEKKPLVSVIKMVTQISGVRIFADWKRLQGLGVEPNQTLSLQMQETTLREVLERALEECGLGCMPYRQTLRVVGLEVTEILRDAAKNGEKIERSTLNLEDLATTNTLQGHNAQSGLQEILRLIRMFVHPATWDEYGGPGKMTSSRSAAKVNLSHYPSMAEEVQRFCNQLRFARKMPLQEQNETAILRGRQDGTRMGYADTTPRWIQSEKARKRLISCDFSDGVPLREVLEEIARTAKIQLILDESAIARISVKDLVMDAEIPGYDGKKPDLPTNMLGLKVAKSFENLSTEEVLTDVIRPFPLFCYPVSADLFFMTTPQAAARKTMVEFYPIGDILSKKEAAGVFLDGIRQKIAPQTWKNAGGMGEMVYDAPSRSLIILQSPPVLRQVEHFLEQYRKRTQTARGAKP